MIIKLTKTKLSADGNLCSSITVTRKLDDKFHVDMFDNEKYVKTKTKINRWGEKIKYKTCTRITKVIKKLEFGGIKPSKRKGELAEFHLKQGQRFYYAENMKGSYINYYEDLKK